MRDTDTSCDTPGWLGIGHKWWTLAVVGAGTFMSALDTSVVNVALPVIGKATRASVATVEWVVLAYLITVSSSLLVFGRLADIHGRRRIYMAGLLVFVAGSLGCGLSGTVGHLILARVFQAMGAAMLFALSPAILISAFPGKERGRALGMQATMTYLGVAAGPGLGGILTQHFGWPTIFYMNLPVGLLTALAAWKVLRPDRQNAGQPFDPAGASAMAVTLASLLFVLSKGRDLGWGHPLIQGLAGLAVCAAVSFVVIERRSAHPALDLRLFLNRTFTASVLAAYLCYLASASVSFLIPFYLLTGAGYSASHAGLMMMAVPLAMMAVTGVSGTLSDKVGVRFPATAGMVLMTAGLFLLSGVRLSDSAGHLVVFLAVFGLGTGLFTAPNNSAIMGSVPRDRQGVAGAILAASRTVGFASGVALAGLIYMTCLGSSGDAGMPEAVAHAVRVGLRVTAVFALAGAVSSAVRGPMNLPNNV